MIVLLVTGAIGSGKSADCAYLESKGYPVYYSDDRAKALYDEQPALSLKVDELLGGALLSVDGKLDRSALAARVFGDAGKLKLLESLIHPAVLDDFLGWLSAQDSPLVVMESAIALNLPEFMAHIDKVLLVDAPIDLRLKRACARDGKDSKSILSRMERQSFNPSAADYVLLNDAGLEELRSRTEQALKKMSIFVNCND